MTKMPYWIVLLVLALLCQACSRNPYEKLGLKFEEMPAESESLDIIRLSLERDEKTIKGPKIGGTHLYVQYSEESNGSPKRIIFRSKADPTSEATILFVPEAPDDKVFTIESVTGLGVSFPQAGYYWP